MPTPVLTTLAKLKTHLGLSSSDTTEDILLNQILAETEKAVMRFCKRDFLSAEATEYYDGPGRETLILKRRPVTAVEGVWVDAGGFYGQAAGAFGSDTEWNLGSDFAAPSLAENEANGGLLLSLGNASDAGWYCGASVFAPAVWPEGRGNIKVTYTAGYVTVPDDLGLAIHYLCGAIRQAAKLGTSGPLASETFGEYSYSLLGTGGNTPSGGVDIIMARGILAGYRDVSL